MKDLATCSLPPISKFDAYAASVFALPILTEEEELALAVDVRDNGSQDSAWKLAMAFLRVPVKFARDYKGYGLPMEDMVQEGNIGLLKAIKRFDPSRGVRLSVVASIWVKAEIQAYVLKNWKMLKIATNKTFKKLFFSFRSERQKLENAGYVGFELNEMLAKKLNCSEGDLLGIEMRMTSDISIDEGMECGDKEILMLSSNELENESESREELLDSLSVLSKSEKIVIEKRFLSDEPETLDVVAVSMNLSPGRVHQIEKEALKKLKIKLSESQRV